MAQVLNLDELAQEERVLTLGGKNYTMKEMSVREFIHATREAEKAQKEAEKEGATELEMSEVMEKLVGMISDAFPDCPKEALSGLKIVQLNAILEFMKGDMDKELGETKKQS